MNSDFLTQSIESNPNAALLMSTAAANNIVDDQQYTKFLTRSIMERNDKEIAALNKITKILINLRDEIGEKNMLQFLAKLEKSSDKSNKNPDIAKSEDEKITKRGYIQNMMEDNQDLSKKFDQFQDYMKLRRRLLNRLARRLNRVARCMDGEISDNTMLSFHQHNILPPCIPKYGDLKFDVDRTKVKNHMKRMNDLEAIKNSEENKRRRAMLRSSNQMLQVDSCDERLIEYDDYGEEKDNLNKEDDDNERDDEDEQNLENYGDGVAVIQKNMSMREKILELRRWRNDILACIPDQPTFSELGMEKVWNAADRLKQIEKQEKESSDSESNDDSLMEEDAAKKKREKILALTSIKSKKRLNVLSTPSFYAQDLRRVLCIHADLVETNLTNLIQESISEATTEFEKTNTVSQDLFNRKLKLEAELQRAQAFPAATHMKKKQDIALEMAIAKAKWSRERIAIQNQFNKGVVASCLSTVLDRVTLGFQPPQMLQHHMYDYGLIRSTVSNVLDTMVNKVMFQVDKSMQVSMFTPPKHLLDAAAAVQKIPTGISPQLEADLRKNITELDNLLKAAETERRKAWKKLQKVKSTLLNLNSGLESPKPAIAISNKSRFDTQKQSQAQATAAPVAQNPAASQSVNTATQQPSETQEQQAADQEGDEQARYSADNVKARIYPDGSIMPVSMPKRNKDGLYQRPAGRKRKGMDWDAVRGRWIPAVDDIFDD